MKNFKSKIAVVLSVGMLFGSIIPVLANEMPPDTFRILLDGRPLNVAIDLANFKDDDMTIEEILSEALGGNVVIETLEAKGENKVTLLNRKITDEELKAWIESYEEQGGANEFELEVVRLVNIERAKENLEPLEINELAMKAARFKSQEMRDLKYFAHESPVYGKSYIEVDLFGYADGAYGENIGMGYDSPEDVMNGWMNSPGHRRAIMDKEHKTVGVGFVRGTDISEPTLWTINFGR